MLSAVKLRPSGDRSRRRGLRRPLYVALLLAIVPAGASPVRAQPVVIPQNEPLDSGRVLPAEEDAGDGLTVEVHEALLNRIVRRSELRQSPVRDFILGADVYGIETTTTQFQVDLHPCAEGVAFDCVLRGRNVSDTIGYTPLAAVRTLGLHSFSARKFVLHDGRLFHTRRPRVSVAPCNQTLSADTPLSGVPLLGPLASVIAFHGAEAQRPAGEAVAAEKISDGVGREFNRNIDTELARLNRAWLDSVMPQLQRLQLAEIVIRPSSTEKWARYRITMERPRVSDGNGTSAPAGARVPHSLNAPQVIGKVDVDERFVNRLLERLELQGRTFTAGELMPGGAELAERMGAPEWLELEAIPAESLAALQSLSVRLDTETPLRVAFSDGAIAVMARAAITIPPIISTPVLEITLRYRIDTADADRIVLLPDGIQFDSAAPGAAPFGPLGGLLESQVSALLRPIGIRRDLTLPVDGASQAAIRIQDIRAEGGRLQVMIE